MNRDAGSSPKAVLPHVRFIAALSLESDGSLASVYALENLVVLGGLEREIGGPKALLRGGQEKQGNKEHSE